MKSLAKSGSEMLASARDAYVERLDSSDLAPAQKALLLRLAGLKDAESAKTQTEIEVDDQDGVLSTVTAKRMLKWLAETISRGLELSGGNETTKEILALHNLLLTNMGEIYIENALDASVFLNPTHPKAANPVQRAIDRGISQESSKNEPDFSHLLNLRSAFTIMHLMITCIRTTMIPLASSNISIRREIEQSTTIAMNRMEEKVNSIIQKTIDLALAWLVKLLTNQKKNDFRPRDDGVGGDSTWLEMLQTPVVYPYLRLSDNSELTLVA